MSFSQFGYPYNATSQFFMSPKPSTTCCDSISRSVPDPTNAPQTPASSFCYPSSCEKRLVSGTRTELSAALGVYGAPYAPAHAYANYFQYGADSSSIYSSLAPQYEIKEGTANLHSGISQPSAYYTYDHSLGPYQYDRYGTVDLNGSARRKNATRETTSTLKTWLYEHRKNPYPTKGEKIMLAIITKMTLTQVSTWFANARRRLKKENKMTWSPKNKAGDEKVEKAELESGAKESKDLKDEQDLHLSDLDDLEDEQDDCDKLDSDCEKSNQESKPSLPAFSPPRKNCPALPPPSTFPAFPCTMKSVMALVPDYLDPLCSVQQSQRLPPLPATMASISLSDQKPRIWSLARTAAPEIGRAGVKTETVECQQRGASVQSPGSIGHCENTKDLQESPISEDKGYGTAINRGLLLHCSSYQVSTNSCQYSSLEGSCSRGKPGPESSELSDACLMLQEAKTTAFRPVMKR